MDAESMQLEREMDDIARLQEYRDNMEVPMELLAMSMGELGILHDDNAGLMDHEMVELATRKLRVMHKMLLATGMSEALLKAVMSE